MTTLPPEGNGDATPQQPEGAVPQEAADIANTGASQPPAAPDASGVVPPQAYAAPEQPTYGAPQGNVPPAQPGYGAPQQGYAAPPPGYAAPQQVPATDPASNLTLNYWLSVFFTWLPALIFYIIEKDKGNPQVRALHAANLNFSLLRTAVYVVGWILVAIPILGGLLYFAAIVTLFVFHIIAATKVADTYKRGGGDPFIFNVPLIK